LTKETKMSMQTFPGSAAPRVAALVLASTLFAATATAAPREECVESHGRAQDLREKGQLARARQTFLTCAQSACPALVQQDCARFSEELTQLVPTVTFGARDANAADLPATTVYVDETLFATRLDDGRTYELDPGKHTIRYVHDGKETSLKVVLNQGERGRLLVATFVERANLRRDAAEPSEPPLPSEGRRSALPLVVAGLGAAAAVTGGVLMAIGSSSVPDTCSMSTKECAVPPNDPSLGKAESGVRLANAGMAAGISGLVALAGGLVWYLAQPTTSASEPRRGRIGGPLFTF
jgi:hypothetical protein